MPIFGATKLALTRSVIDQNARLGQHSSYQRGRCARFLQAPERDPGDIWQLGCEHAVVTVLCGQERPDKLVISANAIDHGRREDVHSLAKCWKHDADGVLEDAQNKDSTGFGVLESRRGRRLGQGAASWPVLDELEELVNDTMRKNLERIVE